MKDPIRAYVALGSNLADRARNLGDLRREPAFTSIRVADRQMDFVAHAANGSR